MNAVRSPPVKRSTTLKLHGRSAVVVLRSTIGVLAIGGLVLAACDTGDGTELRDPTAPTTLPPPPTTVATSDAAAVSSGSLDSFGVATIPATAAPATAGPTTDDAQATGSTGAPATIVDGFRATVAWTDGASDGGEIEVQYTCEGDNLAPAISWIDVPPGAVEVAISMVDQSDVTDGRPAINWIMAGIDPSLGRLDENAVPADAVQGLNSFGEVGYTGPCPELGSTHTYAVTLYALEQQLDLSDATPAAQMLDLIGTIAVESTSVSGSSTR